MAFDILIFLLSIFYALTWPDLLKIVLSSRYVRSNNPSLKYQRFTSSGCRTVGIRKFEFLAKPQFLLAEFSLRTGAFKKKPSPGSCDQEGYEGQPQQFFIRATFSYFLVRATSITSSFASYVCFKFLNLEDKAIF